MKTNLQTKPVDLDPRSLIDPIADYHLSNWKRWMESYTVRTGYDSESAVVGNYKSSTSLDDMYDSKDRNDAMITNAVIEDLKPIHQVAIHNIYLACVWRFRGDLNTVFVEAAALFWAAGQKRGLI